MKGVHVKTHRAILIFWDEQRNEPRKVIFGNPDELSALFMQMAPQVFAQIQELGGTVYKSEDQLQEAIDNLENRLPTVHHAKAYGDSHLELSYKVYEDKHKSKAT